jgi:hypothetical protein
LKTQYTLADLAPEVTHLPIACSRCPRYGRLSVARLMRQHGPDATIRSAISGINADCPQRNSHGVMEQCDLYFPGLAGMLNSG